MRGGGGIHCAFVSTNSICQGEQVAAVWKPLKERFGVEIDFAWRTFVWDSEANEKAHVHVVIVGFHAGNKTTDFTDYTDCRKRLFNDVGSVVEATHINGYLMDGPDVFVESRTKPLCEVPGMTAGNRPADGGHLIIEDDEYDAFIKNEPTALPFIKRFVGSEEFINAKKRYCLWLTGITPAQLRAMPAVYRRVELCREDRLNAVDAGRRKLADTPTLFREQMNPKQFLIVPQVSSERRLYAPIGFENQNTIASNLLFIIPNATLYHFGILTSSVHMAWMRVVAGRLEMRYRYSAAIVYNNFPWPDCGAIGDRALPSPNPDALSTSTLLHGQNDNLCNLWLEKISQTAQSILDARAFYPDSSLADLYDPLTMPPELRKAHAANDAAVLAAYGFDPKASESEIVSRLFAMYAKLTGQDTAVQTPPPPNPIRAAPENVVTQVSPKTRPVTSAELAAKHRAIVSRLDEHHDDVMQNFESLHTIARRIDRNMAFMVEREKRDLEDHVYCWEALDKPRRIQVKRVWDWMMDPTHANHDIWTLSRACDAVFSSAPGNYPTARALYDFCHAHEAEFY